MAQIKVAEPARRRPGRPLSFDREEVLEKAMLQFWRTGYETTSVADLTEAMGITAPSLYAAFGDKQSLFLEAVDRYQKLGGGDVSDMIRNAVSARHAVQILLEQAADFYTQQGMPAGCLAASAAATGSADAQEVRAVLQKIRRNLLDALEAKAQDDVAGGQLPADTDVHALAGMTVAMLQGMSTLARDGCSRRELQAVVSVAVSAWEKKSVRQVP